MSSSINMAKNSQYPDLSQKKVTIIYKHSRLSYVQDHADESEKVILGQKEHKITKSLSSAHDNNLAAIDVVVKAAKTLGLDHELHCRSELGKLDLSDTLVIAVGGDGTLL